MRFLRVGVIGRCQFLMSIFPVTAADIRAVRRYWRDHKGDFKTQAENGNNVGCAEERSASGTR